ncbi:MAG: Cell division inhibitor SulA [Pantoea stewartii]|uniref:SOS-induced cell division inhibitor SulA n=1 Tax=Pantoea stewartii TaxID=66269 RepID=UPI0006D00CCF|nr:SOS-induced cell division inhibitor SulA [Pantoea stewartii]WHS97461.1 MAG: Cell division inhibitor SulA [Pantoea stewartii]
MRTQHPHNVCPTHRYASPSDPASQSGWITELRYSEKPGMMQMLLLPLLQQLSQQSRWQLWLTPAHKLSRVWMQEAGLPLEKSMHIADAERYNAVEAMIKALRTGNYSVVLAWIPYDLDEDERRELELAAAEGEALGLILRSGESSKTPVRPESRLKIQSDLFH